MPHRRCPLVWTRLLASWLVAISLLGNGFAAAVAATTVPAASHDCCAGKHAAGGDCDRGGKPCLPGGSAACGGSCVARIGGLMVPALAVIALAPMTAPHPVHADTTLRSPFDPGPGLRPPISA